MNKPQHASGCFERASVHLLTTAFLGIEYSYSLRLGQWHGGVGAAPINDENFLIT